MKHRHSGKRLKVINDKGDNGLCKYRRTASVIQKICNNIKDYKYYPRYNSETQIELYYNLAVNELHHYRFRYPTFWISLRSKIS
jgi:hypothetical protein